MKKLLLLITVALLANNANAQWQSNRQGGPSSVLSLGQTQQMQNPMLGGRQAIPAMPYNNSPAGLVPFANSNRNERTGGITRSGTQLVDSVYQWLLDDTTMAWDINNKNIDYVYDANDNLLSSVNQTWSGSAWVNNQLTTSTYNSSNDKTSQLDQTWSGSAWVNNQLNTYTFNSSNDQTSQLQQTWSGGAWVNDSRDTSIFNSSNEQISSLSQTWSGGVWVNNSQNTYTYNSSNDRTSTLYQTWSGGAWVNNAQYTYTYNSSNDQTSELNQTWSGGAWVNKELYTSTYNSGNHQTSQLYQTWSGGSWVNNEQITFIYNSGNELASDLVQTWSGSAWVNAAQTIFTDNSNNYLTVELDQTWSSGAWVNSDQFIWTYDANNNELWYTYKQFNDAGTAVISGDSVAYYYGTATGINTLSDNATIQIYPNPASNFIHANIELKQAGHLQLSLLNMLGQTVWAADAGNVANYEGDIAVANLPGGVYLLEIITNSGTQSRQVVVTH